MMRTAAAGGVRASPARIAAAALAWNCSNAVISAARSSSVRSCSLLINSAKYCMVLSPPVVSGAGCSTLYLCDERRAANPTIGREKTQNPPISARNGGFCVFSR
ncbi:hypothetical protein I553_0861 [Mycobacterium xenopi 4042]|uniref:Uncharacterized protein n=1 Tax=Mycobacterium xenopi 4042 TaxID=1299334 RepID=X7YI66_MYCXE|nr:hypothetical protein I553_0861 [Mycobacterium xenopi 4042]